MILMVLWKALEVVRNSDLITLTISVPSQIQRGLLFVANCNNDAVCNVVFDFPSKEMLSFRFASTNFL